MKGGPYEISRQAAPLCRGYLYGLAMRPYSCFFMEYLFIGIFLLLAAIEYCKLLRAYFKKKRKNNETTS